MLLGKGGIRVKVTGRVGGGEGRTWQQRRDETDENTR